MPPIMNCILLVDDDKVTNFYHKVFLKQGNYAKKIVEVSSAIEALDYLLSKKETFVKPDIIFLDINMPGLNGWDFLEQYRHLDEKLKGSLIFMFLSTAVTPEYQVLLDNHEELTGYVAKPIEKDGIEEILSNYIYK